MDRPSAYPPPDTPQKDDCHPRPDHGEGKPGDRILAVDGVQVKNWQEFTSRLTEQAPGTPVILELERDGQQQQLEVITEENPNTGLSIIGVSSQVIYEKQGLLTAVKIGLQQTYELTLVLLGGLWIMITGGASAADIAGPVGIVGLIGDAARVGTVFLLSFSAFLLLLNLEWGLALNIN